MARPNFSQVGYTYGASAGRPSPFASDISSVALPPPSTAASLHTATLDGDSSDDCPIAELLQQRAADHAPLLPIRFQKASVPPPAPEASSTVIPDSDSDDAPLTALVNANLPLVASAGVSAENVFLDDDDAPLATLVGENTSPEDDDPLLHAGNLDTP